MASHGRRNGPGRSPVAGKKAASRPPAAGRKPRSRTASSASVRPSEADEQSTTRGQGERAKKRTGGSPGGGRSHPDGTGSGSADGPSGKGSGSAGGAGRLPITKRAAVLALVIAALVVSYASSLRAWVDQRSQIDELEQNVAERREEVRDLEQELERWDDPEYVKAQARERFGWVMPGETGYVVVGRDGRTANQEPEPESESRPQPPWWQALWGSVEQAGNPPEPDPEEQSRQPAEKIGP